MSGLRLYLIVAWMPTWWTHWRHNIIACERIHTYSHVTHFSLAPTLCWCWGYKPCMTINGEYLGIALPHVKGTLTKFSDFSLAPVDMQRWKVLFLDSWRHCMPKTESSHFGCSGGYNVPDCWNATYEKLWGEPAWTIPTRLCCKLNDQYACLALGNQQRQATASLDVTINWGPPRLCFYLCRSGASSWNVGKITSWSIQEREPSSFQGLHWY